jgi:hypothetical protein
MIADRATEHGVAGFKRVEHGAECEVSVDGDVNFGLGLRQAA